MNPWTATIEITPLPPSPPSRCSTAKGARTSPRSCRSLRARRERSRLGPQPQKMFDRIFMIWGLATAFGITRDDLAVFYEQRVLDLVLSEEPTLVHGDFGLHNLLIDPATLHVKFIDFGFSNLRAASSDLMYEFNSDNSYGEHLESGLRAYYETSDQDVSYAAFRIRHAYWHASCYADMFAWQMKKEDLADEEMRGARLDALECIRNGGRYIAAQIAAA